MTAIVVKDDHEDQDDSPRFVKLSEVGRHISKRVVRLQEAYQRDESTAVATLARLRRAISASPGDDPTIWAETLEGLPDPQFASDKPTAEEWAAHLALTLFARHQQSHRDKRMHQPGQSLGHAVRRLSQAIGGDEESSAVTRRFHALGTANSLAEVAHHARGLIGQFRAESIPLDYGLLTDHLVKLDNPRTAASVRLSWARDYYRTPSITKPASPSEQGEETE